MACWRPRSAPTRGIGSARAAPVSHPRATEKSGGDPALERGMKTMIEQESTVLGKDTGPMREMMNYITRALMASRSP
ncbi:hypothetical protein D187_008982 [Cystobacter fuscus DSM 2262]|uniref:Uncharacterized protein n=1 Tax=Cystobacter fuscus (strain ATCC 25194 / DSM 2262 / NBRC 100088 / M29) TaxID=1242864 RepID=S9QNC7_CYSF2|nr:hypothetical protein D187_008982 [Cystobacter fuscus DSM 2262]